MSERKPLDEKELLEFFSERFRELLHRLASDDRRTDVQELIWIVEAYARGQLKDQGDFNLSPRIPLDDLSVVRVFDRESQPQIWRQDIGTNPKPPHGDTNA